MSKRRALFLLEEAHRDAELGRPVLKILNVAEVFREPKMSEHRLLQAQAHAVHVAVDAHRRDLILHLPTQGLQPVHRRLLLLQFLDQLRRVHGWFKLAGRAYAHDAELAQVQTARRFRGERPLALGLQSSPGKQLPYKYSEGCSLS